MAISTYSALQSSVATWIKRSDLTTIIPDFITLAEAHANRVLRVRPMVTRATASLDSEYGSAPGDFIAPIGLTLAASPPLDLTYVSPERMESLEAQEVRTQDDLPQWWSIVGGEFRLYPVPTTSYTAELTYYAKIPALSDSNTSNWLLASHPDVYLFGALKEAASYLEDEEQLQKYATLLEAALAEVRTAYRVSNTTPLRVDPMLIGRTRFDFNRGY